MDIKKQTTIFIRNFFSKFNTTEKLKAGFNRFGPIQSVCILKTPTHEIIGYVEYENKESAFKAIDTMDGISSMKVGLLKECNDSINNLYIKNLPDNVDGTVLNQLFRKYGPIISATIMRDEENVSRGFGFVCFNSEIDAAVAKREMDGFEVSGKKFDISFAQKKESREAFLTAQKKGILKPEEKKKPKLTLEQRVIRPPTPRELASYHSYQCMHNIPMYGCTTDLQRNRDHSVSMMKLPTIFTTPPPAFGSLSAINMNSQPNLNAKPVQQKLQRPKSSFNQGKTGSKAPEKKKSDESPDAKENSAATNSEPKRPVPMQERKEVLQDLILPQLQRMFPHYATILMERFMNRSYKDLLRLAGNHRLLYKTSHNEVQKIKSQANSSKRD